MSHHQSQERTLMELQSLQPRKTSRLRMPTQKAPRRKKPQLVRNQTMALQRPLGLKTQVQTETGLLE